MVQRGETHNTRSPEGLDSSRRVCGGEPWPPYCCVPAFIAAALRALGSPSLDRQQLAHALDTRVGPGCDNPWGLAVEANPLLRGVTVAIAKVRIPLLLQECGSGLHFRHVPFDYVMLRLYAELLEQAVSAGAVVGFGLNYSQYVGKSDVWRHVCRYAGTDDGEHLLLVDDSAGEGAASLRLSWPDVEVAVRDVGDGFWLIGPLTIMSVKHAPPLP